MSMLCSKGQQRDLGEAVESTLQQHMDSMDRPSISQVGLYTHEPCRRMLFELVNSVKVSNKQVCGKWRSEYLFYSFIVR